MKCPNCGSGNLSNVAGAAIVATTIGGTSLGCGQGAALGLAVGGPIGAVVGACAGLYFGAMAGVHGGVQVADKIDKNIGTRTCSECGHRFNHE